MNKIVRVRSQATCALQRDQVGWIGHNFTRAQRCWLVSATAEHAPSGATGASSMASNSRHSSQEVLVDAQTESEIRARRLNERVTLILGHKVSRSAPVRPLLHDL
jgi:hypothetical protein